MSGNYYISSLKFDDSILTSNMLQIKMLNWITSNCSVVFIWPQIVYYLRDKRGWRETKGDKHPKW